MLKSLISGVACFVLLTELARGAPVPVTVEKTETGWRLLRGGEPYFVKAAGGDADREMLVASGGNGFRTWGMGSDTAERLDEAEALGLTVTLGFWLPHKGADVDYANPEFRKQLADRLRAHVMEHRNHPAVLVWAIGNEAEQGNNTPAYWSLVNELAEMVKELDPNHPTMTVTAEMGNNFEVMLAEHCPAVDIWGINSYAGLFSLRKRLDDRGWTRPYMVTEFGPKGHWEVARTEWGAPIEQSSTEKAAQYAWLYENVIAADPRCLGSFVFLWGQKHESTETWFSMFSRGRPTELVDTMHRMWTGEWPDDLAPKIIGLESDLAMKSAGPGEVFDVKLSAFDPEGMPLDVHWEVRSSVRRVGMGAGEVDPTPAEHAALVDGNGLEVKVRTPGEPGAYRLFAFVTDPGGRVATVNIPFSVAAK